MSGFHTLLQCVDQSTRHTASDLKGAHVANQKPRVAIANVLGNEQHRMFDNHGEVDNAVMGERLEQLRLQSNESTETLSHSLSRSLFSLSLVFAPYPLAMCCLPIRRKRNARDMERNVAREGETVMEVQ